MKKIKFFLFVIIMLFVMPSMAEAKEYCKVVSGDGKSIGSEIACGTEHFYVVGFNEDSVRLFAKYNLYTGVAIYREKIDREDADTISDTEKDQICSQIAHDHGGSIKSDAFYNTPGYCYYYVYLDDTIIGQSEEAKSAHWDSEGNYLYPQVGDMYVLIDEVSVPGSSREYIVSNTPINDSLFFDVDLDFDKMRSVDDDSWAIYYGTPSTIVHKLFRYKERLENDGYTISDIGMLKVSELDEIVNKISGQSLPLKDWRDDTPYVDGDSSPIIGVTFGDLKPFIPENYKWLYSTTYWNSTAYTPNFSPYSRGRYFVFTAEQGKLCGAGYYGCPTITKLGCGVRPVISIASSDIAYMIKKKSDCNCEIELPEGALGGQAVSFKVTLKKRMPFEIKTDSGETVQFTEDDVINNSDGTVTISGKFIMPFENINFEVKCAEIVNVPDTLRNSGTIGLLLLIGVSLFAILKIFNINEKKA